MTEEVATAHTQHIATEIEESIQNSEVATIALKYLYDSRKSDIQSLLLSDSKRSLVVDQLKSIADRAYRSLVSSLVEGPEQIHAINGLQARVDALGDELIADGSPLFTEKTYKTIEDPDYMESEVSYHRQRRESGDTRWLAWDSGNVEHIEQAQSVLDEAGTHMASVNTFLKDVQEKSGLPQESVVSTSHRVKGLESLFNKITKFREKSWGQGATIANAVDLLGGRIVVSDLASLEKIMQTVEGLLADNPDMKVLRKENKFIVNHKTSDPYRAIHYIVTFPNNHSFELQLTTFPAVLAGDLAHDAIYKPYLLNLPSELQQIVRDYNWESDERELKDYLGRSATTIIELTPEQSIEKAIAEHDYNSFYDLVIRKIDLKKPLTPETQEYLRRFHRDEVAKLKALQEKDPKLIIELAQAAHNGYFRKNARQLIYNSHSDQLGNALSEDAVAFLTPNGQIAYNNRYEMFTGTNNKLSVEDLELHALSDENLAQFLLFCGKDLERSGTKIQELVEKIKHIREESKDAQQEREQTFVMNLNHAPFEELFLLTDPEYPGSIQNPFAREVLRRTLIEGQIKAIATASILTEVGGYDDLGNARDLSKEALSGTDYSIREMATHMFFITVNRTTSETASFSFEDFATLSSMSWARGNDKVVDQSILTKLVTKQLESIAEALTHEENAILVARLLKARFELVDKYIKNRCTNPEKVEQISSLIHTTCTNQVRDLLSGGEEASAMLAKVKDPQTFTHFSNSITSVAYIPNIFVSAS